MKTLLDNTEGEMTPRKLGELLGLGGSTPIPIGTPAMVADVFERWFNESNIDGYNIVYVSNPERYVEIVGLLFPGYRRAESCGNTIQFLEEPSEKTYTFDPGSRSCPPIIKVQSSSGMLRRRSYWSSG
ncbi:hypothetical protein BP6252_00176 [Coleophoma cylindrospora]|uniref:Luciferase-like domain-containing protein n=1 Tax=Coleophoma cylindrospora TaxID=1849047 RepID=A0A3D8SPN6_9HELO|nr:hypothetical protein BP6252_00176 [Coleophoma cylindrospora]